MFQTQTFDCVRFSQDLQTSSEMNAKDIRNEFASIRELERGAIGRQLTVSAPFRTTNSIRPSRNSPNFLRNVRTRTTIWPITGERPGQCQLSFHRLRSPDSSNFAHLGVPTLLLRNSPRSVDFLRENSPISLRQ